MIPWGYSWFALYFAPPLMSLCVGETFAIYGRVWLFNVLWIFFWPVMMFVIPWRYR